MNKTAKVAIVGAGKVGISAAYTMYLKGTAGEIMLYSKNKEVLIGEQLDFQHSLAFLSNTKISIADDLSDLRNSAVVVFTAGAGTKPGQSRLDLTKNNTEIVNELIPEIVRYAPNALILMVTNPVDVLTYKAHKLAGLSFGRIIGSGTSLDTARFRFHLSELLHINPRSIHAYILGEHGDSSFPTLSTANAGGQLLSSMNGLSEKMIQEAYEKTRDAAYKIIEAKGATYYAIGVVINELVYTMLRDGKRVYPLSVPLEGEYGQKGLALSVPCVLGRNGVERILEIPMSEEEKQLFNKSADIIRSYM